MGGMKTDCWSLVPTVVKASITPSVSKGHKENARLAALMFSLAGAPTSLGRPCPPHSCSCCSPCQPPCANSLKACLKPGEVVTLPSDHLAGDVSPSRLRGAIDRKSVV